MSGVVARLFGSANDRRMRAYRPRVGAINVLERDLEHLSADELRARTETFRQQLAAANTTGKTLGDVKANASADQTNVPADEKGTPGCSAP